MSFWENTRKPAGLGGRLMVSAMNIGHRALAGWGRSFLTLPADAKVLDCGCGGGANLRALLKKCPQGTVKGIDYSAVSATKAARLNGRAIADGRCVVQQGSVAKMPFASAEFDAVTAFETVYCWGELPRCFQEIYRVLKPDGTFLICNECGGDRTGDDRWTRRIAGMTVYRDTQLAAALEQAGFREIRMHRHKRGWLCVSARK